MLLSTPSFWFKEKSIAALLLQPLAFLYNAIGVFLRSRIKIETVSVPVICVGNVLVGGSGKTPVVRTLVTLLQTQGHIPHIISRGYGGYLRGPVQVDVNVHTIGEVGDEPLMLSACAPVWVSKNKVAGAKAAIAAGATHIILDDGLQNPSLKKDVSFLVMDAGRGIGSGFVLPAGPLRETLADALSKSTAVIWIGKGNDTLKQSIASQKPMITATAKTISLSIDLTGQKCFAFCGLGNSQKFYDGLKQLGVTIVKTRDFPDHYVWSVYEFERLLAEAKSLGALPVTTAKDAVRIPRSLRKKITICDVALEITDSARFLAFLNR